GSGPTTWDCSIAPGTSGSGSETRRPVGVGSEHRRRRGQPPGRDRGAPPGPPGRVVRESGGGCPVLRPLRQAAVVPFLHDRVPGGPYAALTAAARPVPRPT